MRKSRHPFVGWLRLFRGTLVTKKGGKKGGVHCNWELRQKPFTGHRTNKWGIASWEAVGWTSSAQGLPPTIEGEPNEPRSSRELRISWYQLFL